jgi:hypothetical protein
MILTALVVVGVPLVASTGLFLFWRGRPKMATSKTKLSVQLDTVDYNRLRFWADRKGVTISDFVRNALLRAVPVEEQAQIDKAEQTGSLLDRVFEELDKAEDPFTGVFPMPPARKPQLGVPTEAERTHPAQRVTRMALTPTASNVPPGPHSCVHLLPQTPTHLRGQCQGTCNQIQQRGRPCYYAPTIARGCQVFEPKLQGDRVKQVR